MESIQSNAYFVHQFEWPAEQAVNLPLLKEQLSTALGAAYANAYLGDSETISGGALLTVMLQTEPVDADATIQEVIAAHVATDLTQSQQDTITSLNDEASFKDAVSQAIDDGQIALTVIGDVSAPGSDIAILVMDREAVNSATLAAPLKTALLDVIDIQSRVLNRQKLVIQILLSAIKALRWLVTV